MGRQSKFAFTLATGQTVGYSFKKRGKYLFVQFSHPTEDKYVELGTGCTTLNDAHTSAAKLVLKVYAPTFPPDKSLTSWETAIRHLEETPDLRQDSVRAYLTAIRALRHIVSAAKPDDVTVADAQKFKRDFLNGQYKRGKSSDAVSYKRASASCATYLRSLRSLWKKHFKPNGFVKTLPFADVPYPNLSKDKRVRMPSEESLNQLLIWLDQRYPDWPLPRLFVEIKSLAGCRTLDLCKTLASSLVGNILTLTDEVTKTRSTRQVPLPDELARRLHEVKGKTWLWERSVEDCKIHRWSARTQHATAYDPKSWLNTVNNLFREFNEGKEKKDQVRPHDLRSRAITLVAGSTQSVDLTAEAMGVDPQTARYYLDASKAFKGSEVLKKLSSILLPITPPETEGSPPEKGKCTKG